MLVNQDEQEEQEEPLNLCIRPVRSINAGIDNYGKDAVDGIEVFNKPNKRYGQLVIPKRGEVPINIVEKPTAVLGDLHVNCFVIVNRKCRDNLMKVALISNVIDRELEVTFLKMARLNDFFFPEDAKKEQIFEWDILKVLKTPFRKQNGHFYFNEDPLVHGTENTGAIKTVYTKKIDDFTENAIKSTGAVYEKKVDDFTENAIKNTGAIKKVYTKKVDDFAENAIKNTGAIKKVYTKKVDDFFENAIKSTGAVYEKKVDDFTENAIKKTGAIKKVYAKKVDDFTENAIKNTGAIKKVYTKKVDDFAENAIKSTGAVYEKKAVDQDHEDNDDDDYYDEEHEDDDYDVQQNDKRSINWISSGKTFTVPLELWQKVYIKNKIATRDWTYYKNKIGDFFDQQLRTGCILILTHKNVGKNVITLRGHCKHPGCRLYSLKYDKKKGVRHASPPFLIRYSQEELNHEFTFAKQLRGVTRDEYQEGMNHKKPGTFTRDLVDAMDEELYKRGNANVVKSDDVIYKAHSEHMLKQDFAKDDFDDLVALQKSTAADPYISKVLSPFAVYIHSEIQYKVLEARHKRKGSEEIVALLDATGNVVKVTSETSEHQVLYYPLIIPIKGDENDRFDTLFPVTESLNSAHAVPDISGWLNDFNEKFIRFNPTIMPTFDRIITDFSYANIHGVLHAFQRMRIHQYLYMCYKFCVGLTTYDELEHYVKVQLCTTHLTNTFVEFVREFFRSLIKGKKTTYEQKYITEIFGSMMSCKSYNVFKELFRNICILLLSKFQTPSVVAARDSIVRLCFESLITANDDLKEKYQFDKLSENSEKVKQMSECNTVYDYNESILKLPIYRASPFYSDLKIIYMTVLTDIEEDENESVASENEILPSTAENEKPEDHSVASASENEILPSTAENEKPEDHSVASASENEILPSTAENEKPEDHSVASASENEILPSTAENEKPEDHSVASASENEILPSTAENEKPEDDSVASGSENEILPSTAENEKPEDDSVASGSENEILPSTAENEKPEDDSVASGSENEILPSTAENEKPRNRFYNTELIEEFMKRYGGILPLWTGFTVPAGVERYNNQPVESYVNIAKSLMKEKALEVGSGKVKPVRFIIPLRKLVISHAKRYLLKVPRTRLNHGPKPKDDSKVKKKIVKQIKKKPQILTIPLSSESEAESSEEEESIQKTKERWQKKNSERNKKQVFSYFNRKTLLSAEPQIKSGGANAQQSKSSTTAKESAGNSKQKPSKKCAVVATTAKESAGNSKQKSSKKCAVIAATAKESAANSKQKSSKKCSVVAATAKESAANSKQKSSKKCAVVAATAKESAANSKQKSSKNCAVVAATAKESAANSKQKSSKNCAVVAATAKESAANSKQKSSKNCAVVAATAKESAANSKQKSSKNCAVVAATAKESTGNSKQNSLKKCAATAKEMKPADNSDQKFIATPAHYLQQGIMWSFVVGRILDNILTVNDYKTLLPDFNLSMSCMNYIFEFILSPSTINLTKYANDIMSGKDSLDFSIVNKICYMPIMKDNWVLYVINNIKNTYCYFDPCNPCNQETEEDDSNFDFYSKFISAYNASDKHKNKLNSDKWKQVPFHSGNTLESANDSGIHVIHAAHIFITRATLTDSGHQFDVEKYREELLLEVLNYSDELKDLCLKCGQANDKSTTAIISWKQCKNCRRWIHELCLDAPLDKDLCPLCSSKSQI